LLLGIIDREPVTWITAFDQIQRGASPNNAAAFETKMGESAATTSAHHLPARKGAHVLAHGLPLPKPETVILANQNNFSIFHGIFSI